MLDVKELFTADRWRLLHGSALATAPNGLTRGPLWPEACAPKLPTHKEDGCQTSWLRFPDPAGQAMWQSHASRAEELLKACGQCLQSCHRDAVSSRQLLRACRSQLEAHQACSAAVRDLLGDEVTCGTEKENHWAAEAVIAKAAVPDCAARPARCIGRSRCFFCREKQALEEELGEPRAGDPWELDSAVLADGSNCGESLIETPQVANAQPFALQRVPDSDEVEEEMVHGSFSKHVQRRRTYRQRERRVFKARVEAQAQKPRPADNTWFAKHTVDPALDDAPGSARGDGGASSRSPPGRSRSPVMKLGNSSMPVGSATAPANVVFSSARGQDEGGGDAEEIRVFQASAELEPYTSAAARFRAEMEFLDVFSFPGSPVSPSRNWPARTEPNEGSSMGAFAWSQDAASASQSLAKVSRSSSKEQVPPPPAASILVSTVITEPVPPPPAASILVSTVITEPVPPPPQPPPPPTDTLPLSSIDSTKEAPREARTKEAAEAHLASKAVQLCWKQLVGRLVRWSGLEPVLRLSVFRSWAKLPRQKRSTVAMGAVFQPFPPKRTASRSTSTAGSPALLGATAKAKAKQGLRPASHV